MLAAEQAAVITDAEPCDVLPQQGDKFGWDRDPANRPAALLALSGPAPGTALEAPVLVDFSVHGGQHQLRRLPQQRRPGADRGMPVVGSYGGKDRSPMGASAAARLELALTALDVDHDVKIYPRAGHGFINDHDPADMTALLVVLNKLSGTSFHEPAAHDAHRRTAAFFHRHLAA